MLKTDALADTPSTKVSWKEITEHERLILISRILTEDERYSIISISTAADNGQVLITLNNSLAASERGTLLLDFERNLKDKIDRGINVWCEPIGDKNSLRNLRGIQIKE